MQMAPLFRCSKCGENKALAEFPPSKIKNNRQWCSECLRWSARRGKGLTAHEHDVTCGWCGDVFSTTYTKAQFCSRECKHRYRARIAQDAIDAAKPLRRCVWCGADIPRTMRADAKFCSADCNGRAHRTMRNWRRRSGELAPLKPRKNPLPSFIDIAERDGWKCGICGKPVNKKRKFPDPLGGSLDHLIPVSKGGSHQPENLQLSHFVCNWTKRDSAANDRLRLLG